MCHISWGKYNKINHFYQLFSLWSCFTEALSLRNIKLCHKCSWKRLHVISVRAFCQIFSYLIYIFCTWTEIKKNKKSVRLGPITLIRSERAGPGPALHRQNHKQLHRWKRIPEITLKLPREILHCFYFQTYALYLATDNSPELFYPNAVL